MQDQQILNKFHKWRDDWNLFAKEILQVILDPEQKEILTAVQYNKRVSVVSGTTRGKDFVAAVAALCYLYLSPRWDEKGNLIENTKIIMTAPTFPQIENIIFPEISRIFNRVGFLPGRLVGCDIRTENKEWFLTGFKADDKNHEAWTGFHAVHVMYVITEASGIDENIYSAIEGNVQSDDKILLAFNFNTSVGYAANTQTSPDWKKFRLDCLTAPNVLSQKKIIPGQIEYPTIIEHIKAHCILIEKGDFKIEEGDFEFDGNYYRPDDWFRIKVRGLPPKVSEDVLIPHEWILIANENWKKSKPENKTLRLGIDVAGMGRDSSCFCLRRDNYVQNIEKMHNLGDPKIHMQVAGKIKNILESNDGAYAFIDTIGEGAGVYSRLVEQEVKGAYSCKFSEAAEINDKPLKDVTDQYEFLNLRAYCYWAIRDWLNPVNKINAALPPDEELTQELTSTKWKVMSNGKRQIEAKELIKARLKRSPDKADSLANTFCPIKPKRVLIY